MQARRASRELALILFSQLDKNLEKYNPDILVITGHDAYYRKKRN